MKIEKVKNGFIVEVDVENPEYLVASRSIRFSTEKYICNDLIKLLDFVNTHYSEEPKLKPGAIVEIK